MPELRWLQRSHFCAIVSTISTTPKGVALARAFNGRPDVLFADEPTGNLDRQTGDKIADLLFSLNREHGTTLIMVTHDLQLAARCDRCLRLVNGQLQEEA